MKPLKKFSDFLKEGIVRKQSPDKERAKSLIKESYEAYKFLNEIIDKFRINENNSNYIIKNVYDIIMELIRAKMIIRGFNCKGSYSHEAEVSYMRELNFSENEVQFMNQLRFFRNRIVYYGKSFDKEYAEKVFNFLNKMYHRLKL